MDEDPMSLLTTPLFEGLAADELARLKGLLHARAFPPGRNIITVDQPGDVVFILKEGSVKIFVDQLDGTEVILAFLGPGDVVGEMSPLDSRGRSANVVTLERCTCLSIDRPSFDACLRSIPLLSYNFLRLMARRLRLADEQIQALATLDVKGRVARQILAFAQQYGLAGTNREVTIPLRLTQTDLAALVGASRERVNQVIVDFKESGLLSVDPSHRITVHNLTALADRCQ